MESKVSSGNPAAIQPNWVRPFVVGFAIVEALLIGFALISQYLR